MAASKEEKYESENKNNSTMNGFLEKQSLHVKVFRKRWISLQGNCLFSYKAKDDQNNPTEIIDLNSFEYICGTHGHQFEIITTDNKTKRVFIAPSMEEQNKWIKSIKNACKIKEMNQNNVISENIELPTAKIKWNDTNEIWEYYWSTDGCKKNNIHKTFSCKEMINRNECFFKKVSEPIMFKRIQDKQWLNSSSVNFVDEIKKYNTK
eukprot:466533_1